MAVNLPKLADAEKLSTNIIRVLGGNPGKFTLQGSNTFLLGSGPRRLLLDTGQGEPAWCETLSRVLKEENCSISSCLLSHWHHDHVGGVKDLQTKVQPREAITIYKNSPSLNPDSILNVDEVHNIADGQKFSTPGSQSPFEVTSLHSPGHTKDHMAFIVTSSPDPSELGAIFTADNVLGHGTAVFEDLHAYLSSLALMKSAVSSAGQKHGRKIPAYPGHGAVIPDAEAKIEEYIAHRRMREEEALNVLRYGMTAKQAEQEANARKEWGSMDMVRIIYSSYPQNLWEPAEYGLLMVLEKLRREGRVVKVERDGDVKWKVGEKATL